MSEHEIPRPASGDVVELILDDHRLFERLMREMRDSTADRAGAREAFAQVLVAHGESEELHVYPALKRKTADVGEEEVEHSEEEHAEIKEALLALLECKGTDNEKFDDAVEKLNEVLQHHITEEELTILNPAREDTSEQVRADLGAKFVQERSAQLDAGCGSVDNVRRLVAKAHAEGLLPADDEEEDEG